MILRLFNLKSIDKYFELKTKNNTYDILYTIKMYDHITIFRRAGSVSRDLFVARGREDFFFESMTIRIYAGPCVGSKETTTMRKPGGEKYVNRFILFIYFFFP